MTKDELQKEAYEWTEKNISVGISMYNPSIEMYCAKAYEEGAEPREKQINELETTCNKWFEHLKNREKELLNELNNQNAKYNKQIEELE
jgi:hypothetical protein